MANKNLSAAKNAKQDEFYTQYGDIQKEVNAYLERDKNVFRGKTVLLPCDDPEWSNFTRFFAQNFEMLGLKKLISTSYAIDSKIKRYGELFGYNNGTIEEDDKAHGKIFVLDHDTNNSGRIDVEDLEWSYLEGDGDFRSEEVKKLRDEADIIVTNPPFSLFREFLSWILGDDGRGEQGERGDAAVSSKPPYRAQNGRATSMKSPKDFLIIGNMNAITYKEVFPLIKENMIWLGATNFNVGMYFYVPKGFVYAETYKFEREINGRAVNRVPGVCWFTTLDHGRRHQPLELMTEAENIKHSRHGEVRGVGYRRYDNYDAIEVPFTDAIPDDYEGVMGVPISFLDKYCPEQFEILGMCENEDLYHLKTKIYSSAECKAAYLAKFHKTGTYDLNASGVVTVEGLQEKVYQRILIRQKKGTK